MSGDNNQPEITDLDPDDAELAELEKEIAEEEAKGVADKADPDTAAEPPVKEEDQPEATTEAKDAPSQTTMIPKPRLDQEADKVRRLQAEKDYLQAQLEAAQRAKPAEPVETPPTIDEQRAALEAERDAILDKVDSMEIPTKDGWKQAAAIEKKIEALSQPASVSGPKEDLYLREKTTALTAEHPYIAAIDQLPDASRKWDFLESEAETAMRTAGTPLNHSDPASVLQFRQRLATLADQYGPLWAGEITPPSSSPKNATGDQSASRRAKLDMADTHPPDVTALGRSGIQQQPDISALTEEQFDAMTPQQQKELMKGVL